MKNILVTGGAGYIGSHTCKALSIAGYNPVTYDNLSMGHEHAVKWGPLEIGDIRDKETLSVVFEKYNPKAVIHFASKIVVSESVKEPESYYDNNVNGTANLLTVMKTHSVNKIVFSSTVALRYFNAAGADPEGELGEEHEPETHLIPLILKAVKGNTPVSIFGDDYATPDGTCIRDYIHVSDLASAHIKALKYLKQTNQSEKLNLGTGRGYSVREVLDTVKEITAKVINEVISERRDGDPDSLIAKPDVAKTILDWQPQHSDLKNIIKTVWEFSSADVYKGQVVESSLE